jgi:hypothetical protein
MIGTEQKVSLRYLISLIFVVTSGYYITKLPLSPIYFFAIISFYLYGIFLFMNRKIVLKPILIIPFIYIIYLSLTQYMVNASLSTSINVVMSLSYFIISYMLLYSLSSQKLENISVLFIRFSLPLVVFEAYYRLSNPKFILESGFDYRDKEDILFYAYKLNSIMYQDSNFVGIFLVALFFFAFYLWKEHLIKLKIEMILLFFLIILTISRAAIVSTIFFLLFFYLWYKSSKFTKLMVFIISIILLVIAFILLGSDSSFQSKFHILNLFLDFIKTSNIIDFLFGIGFGNTVSYLGIGAHNFIVAHFVESGLIGFLLLVTFYTSIIFISKNKILIVLLPFLLTGMSLAGHAIPYLYTIFVLIILLEKHKGKYIESR